MRIDLQVKEKGRQQIQLNGVYLALAELLRYQLFDQQPVGIR